MTQPTLSLNCYSQTLFTYRAPLSSLDLPEVPPNFIPPFSRLFKEKDGESNFTLISTSTSTPASTSSPASTSPLTFSDLVLDLGSNFPFTALLLAAGLLTIMFALLFSDPKGRK